MPRVTFTIRYRPKPKQSARFFRSGDGIRSYQPKPVREHAAIIREDVSAAWADRPAMRGPVAVEITCHYPWPKATPKWKRRLAWYYGRKVTQPDLENLEKMLLDGMEGIVFWNDRQVWHKVTTKRFGDGPARTEVAVEWDPEPERPAR